MAGDANERGHVVTVRVDVSEVHAMAENAAKGLGGVNSALLDAAKRAAKDERREHVFKNITGRLQASIEAVGVLGSEIGSDDAIVVLSAGTPYAGYVEARGRLDMAGRADQVDSEFSYFVDSIPDTI